MEYTVGQVAVVTGTFTSGSANVDPTTITFTYTITPSSSAAGNPVVITYAGASIPGLGEVARTAQGVYVVELDTTALPGVWTGEWKSTGIGQAVSDPDDVVFVVRPAAI